MTVPVAAERKFKFAPLLAATILTILLLWLSAQVEIGRAHV